MTRIFNKIYCLYLICIVLLSSCALKPESWAPPKNNLLSDVTLLNNQLTKSEQIDLAGNYGPKILFLTKKAICIVVFITKLTIF